MHTKFPLPTPVQALRADLARAAMFEPMAAVMSRAFDGAYLTRPSDPSGRMALIRARLASELA